MYRYVTVIYMKYTPDLFLLPDGSPMPPEDIAEMMNASLPTTHYKKLKI